MSFKQKQFIRRRFGLPPTLIRYEMPEKKQSDLMKILMAIISIMIKPWITAKKVWAKFIRITRNFILVIQQRIFRR